MITLLDWQVDPPEPGELASLVGHCVDVDRVSPISGHVLDATGAPPGTRFLLALDSARLAGIAVLPPHDPAELAVHPADRRRGIGAQLMTAVLERTGRVWAHGDLPAAQVLANKFGLHKTRELLQMRRPLAAPFPASPAPDGVLIRTFVPGADEDAFLAVNARAFAWHPEQWRLDRVGLARETSQDWFDPAGFFLAVDGVGRLLGYHWTKVHPVDETPAVGAPAGPIGEIYVLGVDPESPVRRLGTPLSVVGLEYLRGRGLDTAMLYVEGDNDRAVQLYDRLGFRRYLTDVVYQR